MSVLSKLRKSWQIYLSMECNSPSADKLSPLHFCYVLSCLSITVSNCAAGTVKHVIAGFCGSCFYDDS